LSESHKQILIDAMNAGMEVNDKLRIDSEKNNLEFLKKKGMAIIDIDIEPFIERCKDIPLKSLGEEYKSLLEQIELAGK